MSQCLHTYLLFSSFIPSSCTCACACVCVCMCVFCISYQLLSKLIVVTVNKSSNLTLFGTRVCRDLWRQSTSASDMIVCTHVLVKQLHKAANNSNAQQCRGECLLPIDEGVTSVTLQRLASMTRKARPQTVRDLLSRRQQMSQKKSWMRSARLQ